MGSQRWTLDHYIKAFTLVPFGRYFFNSLVMAFLGVVANLLLGSLSRYAFARLRFRGREGLFRIKLASLLVPGVVTLIPSFIILRSFPLVGGNDLLGHRAARRGGRLRGIFHASVFSYPAG